MIPLNAALTGNSPRAVLTQNVLNTIREYNPEIIALQETKLPVDGPSQKHLEIIQDRFPDYEMVWNCSGNLPARDMQAPCFYIKTILNLLPLRAIGAPGTRDFEGRIITFEFANFYLTQVYTPNAGEKL